MGHINILADVAWGQQMPFICNTEDVPGTCDVLTSAMEFRFSLGGTKSKSIQSRGNWENALA